MILSRLPFGSLNSITKSKLEASSLARTPGLCEQNVNNGLKGYENGTFDVKE